LKVFVLKPPKEDDDEDETDIPIPVLDTKADEERKRDEPTTTKQSNQKNISKNEDRHSSTTTGWRSEKLSKVSKTEGLKITSQSAPFDPKIQEKNIEVTPQTTTQEKKLETTQSQPTLHINQQISHTKKPEDKYETPSNANKTSEKPTVGAAGWATLPPKKKK